MGFTPRTQFYGGCGKVTEKVELSNLPWYLDMAPRSHRSLAKWFKHSEP